MAGSEEQPTGVVWLEDVGDAPAAEVGGKALRLAALGRAGLAVPRGFCVPAAAYRSHVAANGLGALIEALDHDVRAGLAPADLRARAAELRRAIEAHDLPPSLLRELVAAGESLGGALAVRSSALDEDGQTTSFAGQLETSLAVLPAQIALAVRRGWASLWTERAISYRAERGLGQRGAATAILVQEMVACEVAGIAFTRHPVTGADEVVVEATWGLGEALARGEVTPDRYVLDLRSLAEAGPALGGRQPRRRAADQPGAVRGAGDSGPAALGPARQPPRCLSSGQLIQLGRLVASVERCFGEPQDVEWGLAGGQWFILQARPITALAERSVYTDVLPGDDAVWTSGFLEERFPEPLSPLGWSVVQRSFEELALRDPLRYLGAADVGPLPLTRLYRGHPYVNSEVFRRLYKLFPDALLPEDAARYFPDGDTGARRAAARPRSVADLGLWVRLISAWARDPGNWSPLSNHREWERFVPEYDRTIDAVERLASEEPGQALPAILDLAGRVGEANAQLLRIHRWSLTHADLLYTLLRRLGRAWLGPAYQAICSDLVAHLSDRSLEMDAALHRLVESARRSAAIAAALEDSPPADLDGLAQRLAGVAGAPEFCSAIAEFLAVYGHRSFSLDILHAGFAADPGQFLRVLGSLVEQGSIARNQAERRRAAVAEAQALIRRSPWGRARWAVFGRVLGLAQTYVRLREDQRFHWQKGMAALRRLYLLAGERLAALGALAAPGDVFFLLEREVAACAAAPAGADGLRAAAAARRAEHLALQAEFERSPGESYPRFLQAGRPLGTSLVDRLPARQLRGQPVSPGQARGRVKVVLTPAELPELGPGDILVTRGADPGWTPLFGKIGGLVMESGGQLSHGSVVAREYGIPAVVGIAGATESLRDGELVLVDGEAGTVARLEAA